MNLKLQFSLPLSLALCLVPNFLQIDSVGAQQITSDGTTGTTVTSDGNNFTIQDGTRNGSNLFHSFQDFSVPTGGSAFFDNANDISNILSRVTGGNLSNIDGLIRANGSTNLFLINPAGIIFGEGASLAIGGSFYGSTAESILFDDGEFSAVNNLDAPILTINAPIGLNFRDNPSDIVTNGTENAIDTVDFSLLAVAEDQSINLIGGNIDLNNTILFAPGGNIELGGLQTSGTVNINDNGGLSFPENIARGNISLDNSQIFADFSNDGEGGSINLNANNIELLNASFLRTGIDAGSGFVGAQAGDINLNATGTIDISGGEGIFNQVVVGGIGNAGDIKITTDSLTLRDGGGISSTTQGTGNGGNINLVGRSLLLENGARIDTRTFGQGDAGTISMDISENVSFANNSGALSQVGITQGEQGEIIRGEGNAGNIEVTTANLSLTGGSQLTAGVFGNGDAGEVIINATESVLFQGTNQSTGLSSGVINNVASGGVGNAGDIKITTDSLTLRDGGGISSGTEGTGNGGNINLVGRSLLLENGARINASTFGQGDAGSVSINASESITLDRTPDGEFSTGIFNTVAAGAQGQGGAIDVTTTNLSIANGAVINAGTFGEGDGGSILVNASESITLNGAIPDGQFVSGIGSAVAAGAKGKGGGVDVTTTNLSISNGAIINAGTSGEGNGGSILVNASESITLDGTTPNGQFSSGIFNTVAAGAIGQGGGIDVTTTNLSIANGAGINAGTSGEGDGGSILVNAGESITLDGTTPNGQFVSGIFNTVAAGAIGQGGGIDVTTNNLSIANGAAINAGTSGEGDGGSILVNASESITLDGITPNELSSGIGSSVEIGAIGNGGSVEINTPNLIIANGAGIFASTEGDGDGGNITLNISDRLELRENSSISVEASEPNTNGGDITINAADGFVVAFPNENEGNGSDISAFSRGGEGGNIIIEAQGVLGIEERDAIPGNNTNDIDASGTIEDGSVEITSATTDAIQGANQLPSIPVEPGETVVQACSTQRGIANSNLVIKGKGGVPSSPDAILSSEIIRINGEAINSQSPNREDIQPISTSKGDIILARGVEITEDGGIVLTAYKTDHSSRNPQQPVNCN